MYLYFVQESKATKAAPSKVVGDMVDARIESPNLTLNFNNCLN